MLCENLCERNFSKAAKIGKKQKRCGKTYLTNSIVYNTLRGLGNSEVLSKIKACRSDLQAFLYFVIFIAKMTGYKRGAYDRGVP